MAPGAVAARSHYESTIANQGSVVSFLGTRSARQWIRRWGVKRSRIARQVPISAETVQAKVAWLQIGRAPIGRVKYFLARILVVVGPVFGTVFRSHFLIPNKAKVPKRGPFFGPIYGT